MEALNDFELGVDLEYDGSDGDVGSLKGEVERPVFRSKVSSSLGDAAIELRLTHRAEENAVGVFKLIEAFIHHRNTTQSNRKMYVVSKTSNGRKVNSPSCSNYWFPAGA